MNQRIIVALTPREKELYDTLEEAGGWLSRNQIAQIQGKHSLSPHDFQLLDRLGDKGLIEVEFNKVGSLVRGTYLYRAVSLAEGNNS